MRPLASGYAKPELCQSRLLISRGSNLSAVERARFRDAGGEREGCNTSDALLVVEQLHPSAPTFAPAL